MNEEEGYEDQNDGQIPLPLNAISQIQHAEFLRFLLDPQDSISAIEYELEGKEIVYEGDKPSVRQIRPPFVNPTLKNQIMSFLKTYNTKGFSTTKLNEKEINFIIFDLAHAVIDLLELSRRYSSMGWEKNKIYNDHYPAFLDGAQTQILLMIEHTVHSVLKRSEEGTMLDKVTGMHQSFEQKNTGQQQRKGILSGLTDNRIFK